MPLPPAAEPVQDRALSSIWDAHFFPTFAALTDEWLPTNDLVFPGMDSMRGEMEFKSGYNEISLNNTAASSSFSRAYAGLRRGKSHAPHYGLSRRNNCTIAI